MSFDALGDSGGSELADEIGLGCAARYYRSRPNIDGFGEEEFEFTPLVAASGESREVIAFDPNFGAQFLGEIGKDVAGGGEDAQWDSRQHYATV